MSKQTDLINVTDAITVDGSNVGIGTSSPSAKFEVYGPAVFDGSGVGLITVKGSGVAKGNLGQANYTISGASPNDFGVESTNNLLFGTGSTERMRIDSVGRVTMPYQPAWFATGNVGFFTTSSGGVIPLAAVQLNVGNHYSTSGSKFTAPVSGTYQINLMTYMESTSQIVLKKNGADYIPTGGDTAFLLFSNSSTAHSVSASGIVYLNANDYIQMSARNNQSVYLYTGHTSFSGYLIG